MLRRSRGCSDPDRGWLPGERKICSVAPVRKFARSARVWYSWGVSRRRARGFPALREPPGGIRLPRRYDATLQQEPAATFHQSCSKGPPGCIHRTRLWTMRREDARLQAPESECDRKKGQPTGLAPAFEESAGRKDHKKLVHV